MYYYFFIIQDAETKVSVVLHVFFSKMKKLYYRFLYISFVKAIQKEFSDDLEPE